MTKRKNLFRKKMTASPMPSSEIFRAVLVGHHDHVQIIFILHVLRIQFRGVGGISHDSCLLQEHGDNEYVVLVPQDENDDEVVILRSEIVDDETEESTTSRSSSSCTSCGFSSGVLGVSVMIAASFNCTYLYDIAARMEHGDNEYVVLVPQDENDDEVVILRSVFIGQRDDVLVLNFAHRQPPASLRVGEHAVVALVAVLVPQDENDDEVVILRSEIVDDETEEFVPEEDDCSSSSSISSSSSGIITM